MVRVVKKVNLRYSPKDFFKTEYKPRGNYVSVLIIITKPLDKYLSKFEPYFYHLIADGFNQWDFLKISIDSRDNSRAQLKEMIDESLKNYFTINDVNKRVKYQFI